MKYKKEPSNRESFSLNIEKNILDKLLNISNKKGIPLNTYINIILDRSIQKYQ